MKLPNVGQSITPNYHIVAINVNGQFDNNRKLKQLTVAERTIDVFDMKNKSSIYRPIGIYAKRVLVSVVHFFKVRWTAKRFNIWTEELDKTCKEGYWLGYDNKIYYGHPMAVFFLSAQKRWAIKQPNTN